MLNARVEQLLREQNAKLDKISEGMRISERIAENSAKIDLLIALGEGSLKAEADKIASSIKSETGQLNKSVSDNKVPE